MKKIIFSLMCIFIITGTSAQSFNKGDKVINSGFGLGNTLYSGSNYKTTVPPLSASFEYGLVDHLFDDKSAIGIGGYLGYAASKYDLGYSNYDYKYASVIVAARSSLHYALIRKTDTYAGFSLGYDFVSHKSKHAEIGSYTAEGGALYWGWFLGARYYFTDFIAGMVEVGYEIAYFTIGVAFKF